MDSKISNELIQECRRRLLALKSDTLNRIRNTHQQMNSLEKMSGDEVDQSVALLAENHFLIEQDRARKQLLEIEWALARIQSGTFGVCEETFEPIEVQRLLAIPYTRLSVEGAEIRESLGKKFAR